MAEELEKRSDEKLGDYLVRVRETRGMSREELAQKSGLNVKYLEQIEASDWKKFAVEAYLRSYVNSVSVKLGLDPKQVLVYLSSEIGSNYAHEFDAVEPERDFVSISKDQPKSKAKLIIVVLILVVILAALAYVLKLSEGGAAPENASVVSEKVEVEESLESAPEPEGAEAVEPDTTTAAEEEAVRRAVDSVAAAKDLPASATIFISSDSKDAKEKTEKKETVKPGFSKIEIFANGKDSTWLGIKKSASASNYSKQAKFAKEGDKVSYSARDTLFVLVGNPAAVGSIKVNDGEAKLPTGSAGRALRFRVVNGKILNGF